MDPSGLVSLGIFTKKSEAIMSKVKMKAPENSGGCNWNGQEYSVGRDGNVRVPIEAVEELRNHGFTLEGEDEPEGNKEESSNE